MPFQHHPLPSITRRRRPTITECRRHQCLHHAQSPHDAARNGLVTVAARPVAHRTAPPLNWSMHFIVVTAISHQVGFATASTPLQYHHVDGRHHQQIGHSPAHQLNSLSHHYSLPTSTMGPLASHPNALPTTMNAIPQPAPESSRHELPARKQVESPPFHQHAQQQLITNTPITISVTIPSTITAQDRSNT